MERDTIRKEIIRGTKKSGGNLEDGMGKDVEMVWTFDEEGLCVSS